MTGCLGVRFTLAVVLFMQVMLQVPASAETADVVLGEDPLSLSAVLETLEDPDHVLTIFDVASPAQARRFQPLANRDPYLGFVRSAWWGRFTLHNPTAAPVTQIIELKHPVMDRIEFYRPDERPGHFKVWVAGDSVVERDLDIASPNPAFSVHLPAGASKTFYLRLSGDSTLSFKGLVWNAKGYIDRLSAHIDGSAIFIGALMATILYSLSIFAIFREQSYFLFAVFVAAVGVYQAESWGYMTAYVWPETIWISNLSILLSLAVTIFALARFTSKFLNLEAHAPNANALFRALQVLGIIAAILVFIDYYIASRVLLIGMMSGTFAAFIVAIFLWRKGILYARLYAACWSLFCVFALIYGAQKVGWVATGEGVDTAFRIVFAVTVIMFAVAFSDRFHLITKANEARYKMARDQAVAASQAKSKFLATMSHELRTPLNAVIGFSDILSRETLGPLGNDKYREYATDIKDSGSHLLYIINDLLEISRIEAGQVELDEQTIAVPDLLRRCIKIVKDRASTEGIALKIKIADHLPFLFGDETRVQQVMINLLYNAIKFTPRGGQVTLSTSTNDNGDLQIAVSDTGIGIAEEDREKILEPFSQIAPHLTREHGGVGLGLAIAKSIVNLHGGRLDVASVVGEGATFTVLFPPERVIAA